jgi:hypothetical protein
MANLVASRACGSRIDTHGLSNVARGLRRLQLRALVGAPHLRFDGPLATQMNQPPPSGGESGRLDAIYLRSAFAGLRPVKESCKLFKLI